MKKILSTLFIIAITTQFMIAQSTSKADRLFEKRHYETAAKLYLNTKDKPQEVLEKLGDCYYFISDMENATTWYKTLTDTYYAKNTIEPIYLFKYSQALKGINNFEEADKWFNIYNDIEHIVPSENLNTKEYFKALNTDKETWFAVDSLSINTEGSEFGVSIHGDKALFASTRKGGKTYDWNNQPYLNLYEATVDENGELVDPIELNSTINTKKHESNGIITKDGQTLYFSRNQYLNRKKLKNKDKISYLYIHKASLVDGDWANVVELSFNSPDYSIMHPALNFDETRLYFSSDMPGSVGSFDIFYVDINEDGTFGAPKNVGEKINTSQKEQFPYISSKDILYFSSDGHFGMGGLDVFKSSKIDGDYQTPINLSDIVNSSKDDFAFILDEEKETGYFSSNRPGGVGNDDIYKVSRESYVEIIGTAQDKTTLELLPCTHIILFDSQGNLIDDYTLDDAGNFSFTVLPNSTYKLRGELNKYKPSEIEFSTDNKGNVKKEDLLLMMEAYHTLEEHIVIVDEKLHIKINPIYFDFDKWDIREDAAKELDVLVTTLKKYPDMAIEIGAHTDSRGLDEFNMNLSHKRAHSVREYLVANGISDSKVQSKGYGETQPLNNCKEEGICTSKDYDLNRRCEFVIIN